MTTIRIDDPQTAVAKALFLNSPRAKGRVESGQPLPENWWEELPESIKREYLSDALAALGAIPKVREDALAKALEWLTSEEAIATAVERQRLTNAAVGICGMPRPSLENAMGAVLVAVYAKLCDITLGKGKRP